MRNKFKRTRIMGKLSVQSFAKLPNDYAIVERSRSLSLLEEKLIYMLINAMQKRYESEKKNAVIDYDYIASDIIGFDDYRNTMQISSKDNSELIATLKDLFNFTLYVEYNQAIEFIHLFERIRIEKSTLTITYKFHNCFIMYFTGICKDYFKLSIQEVISLNSTYAIRIYQILKTKQNMTICEFEYSIDELKKMLNIQDKYGRYNDFKRFVIELSKQQINDSEVSEFSIDYEEIKTSRAVTSIKFHILKKGKNYYDEQQTLPNYKIDLIKKICQNIKKSDKSKTTVEFILAEKILQELTHKKPLLPLVRNYLLTIERHLDKKFHVFD